MRKQPRILALIFLLILTVPLSAEAAWVTPNKKPVSAWQGFQNSANGAVSHLLPWNWFGQNNNN